MLRKCIRFSKNSTFLLVLNTMLKLAVWIFLQQFTPWDRFLGAILLHLSPVHQYECKTNVGLVEKTGQTFVQSQNRANFST